MKKKVIIIIVAIIFLVITAIIVGYLINWNFLYNSGYKGKFGSSFTKSNFIADKSVMVIVPHEDDEIFLAGATIKNLLIAGDDVKVVFATNGDFRVQGETRIEEAINSLKVLGIKEKNIIFLGYGDRWQTKYNHIYNAPGDALITSYAGKTKTYGTKNHPDFRTSISSQPSLYTRDNYKNDIKDLILKYRPQVIFATDYDMHADHRALTLLFDEAIKDILTSNSNYSPEIFKGYSYNISCQATEDFYNLNMESTILPYRVKLNNKEFELDTPNYNWNDRVRFPVPKSVLAYTKRSSLMYKALEKHVSQGSIEQANSTINSDQVFWERKTTSLTYKANVEVSSGNAKYINDFKFTDSSNIEKYHSNLNNCVWIPEKNDNKKTVTIKFDSPKDISQVSLYDNFTLDNNILKSTLKFSDGSTIDVKALNINGSETVVEFPKKKNVEYVEYTINDYQGDSPGLCELEIYENTKDKTPQYIKIMLDNSTQTFIYRYIVSGKKEIPLNIYIYPLDNLKENLKRCKIYIKDPKNKNIELIGNKIVINNSLKPASYIIRAELIDNANIFDEIEIVVPSKNELKYIDEAVKYEKKCEIVDQEIEKKFTKKIKKLQRKILIRIKGHI